MTLHIESLDSLRIVMPTNMEVSWHLIDENETTQFATFTVVEPLYSFIEYFLGLSLAGLGLHKVVLHGDFCINFGVSTFLNMLDGTDLISIFVKTIFVELTFDVDQMYTGNVDNIETQDRAWAFW